MGERCTISGHIQDAWYFRGSDEDVRLLEEHNRRVIVGLPEVDVWPPLTRGMFSFSPNESFHRDHVVTTFRGQVIYFGGSFSKLYLDLAEWLEKFESLLRRLYWEHAVVVLVTELMGHFTYRWDATPEAAELFSAEPPVPVQEWRFEGGPRSFSGD